MAKSNLCLAEGLKQLSCKSIPSEFSAMEASRLFATHPHMAGTPGDFKTAKDFLEILQRELGISAPDEEPIFSAGTDESRQATLSIPKYKKPQAWIDTYYPVMNTPLERTLQVVNDTSDVIWTADLVERADFTDIDAGRHFDDVPTFHGLSSAGDVTGTLVDGNYCTQEDYGSLVSRGVNLTGSIVMCRYGGIFRGLKVKGGQELGAVGVLIYSDPRDDGTVTVERGYQAYPDGPARNPKSVQRGSVQYLSVYPGDPTTPGYPSYENTTRQDASNIPLIPSLPISWENAQALFRTLREGDSWEGQRVRLANNVDTRVIPIWNTMGVIPGFIKDEVVVIGNHRDAWVMGAADPSSGTSSVHEVIRGLGHLLRNGWKPLRTIVIASWDAEEYGLIGSTEWGEDFEQWISEHVVAYLNLDGSASGSRLSASGSPLLAHLIRDTALELDHPTDASRKLWDARTDTGIYYTPPHVGDVPLDAEVVAIREMETAAADSIGVSPLGSGSDYTVFLQRNGIPSTNGGFGATLYDPVYHYHSIYDSQRWQELYGDPGFYRHVAAAKHLGLQLLRLSSWPVLPYNTTHYANELDGYLDRVENLVSESSLNVQFDTLRQSIQGLRKASAALDDEGRRAYQDLQKLMQDWNRRSKKHNLTETAYWKSRKALCAVKAWFGSPCVSGCPHARAAQGAEGAHAHGDIVDLDKEWDALIGVALHEGSVDPERLGYDVEDDDDESNDDDDDSTDALKKKHKKHKKHRKHRKHRKHKHKLPLRKLKQLLERIKAVNAKAVAFEAGFISDEGIKDREWYKHLAVAPGKWLGYGATTLPGLTEAITFEKDEDLVRHEAQRLEDLISKLTQRIAL
ncbi:Zn-dependent exopeptidase [Panaeolus papilionaceus]|nr:Zn-dependent exopeptidase [Panaeolus papilionaceus]